MLQIFLCSFDLAILNPFDSVITDGQTVVGISLVDRVNEAKRYFRYHSILLHQFSFQVGHLYSVVRLGLSVSRQQSKDTHSGLSGDPKLVIGVNVNGCLSLC